MPFVPVGGYVSSGQNIDPDVELKYRKVKSMLGEVSIDWLIISPVKEGYFTYDKLKDGSITLFDLYKINEIISYTNDFNYLMTKD